MDRIHRYCFSLLLGSAVVVALVWASPAPGQDAGIDGTYRLLKRQIVGGPTLTPPAVMGLSTYSKGARNINVLWHTPDGKLASVSAAATYKLTATEYVETLMFNRFDDPSSGKPPVYSVGGPTTTQPVKRDGRKIQFTPPGTPALVFDGDTYTATIEGVFVDHWERMK
jgi:hypothetical protein